MDDRTTVFPHERKDLTVRDLVIHYAPTVAAPLASTPRRAAVCGVPRGSDATLYDMTSRLSLVTCRRCRILAAQKARPRTMPRRYYVIPFDLTRDPVETLHAAARDQTWTLCTASELVQRDRHQTYGPEADHADR